MTIADATIWGIRQLENSSATPRVDIEYLLSHTLKCERQFLYAYPLQLLDNEQQNHFQQLCQQRQQGKPIAYILGHQPFLHLDFQVNPHTLIPRPETELMVEWILKYFADEKKQVAELGTGCGAIALTLADKRPNWKVIATDISENALEVSLNNAKHYQIPNIQFYLGHWCEALPDFYFDLIISNPPYVADHDPHLQDLRYEPQSALVSGKSGYECLFEIIEQAKNHLNKFGYLVLEHGNTQAYQLKQFLRQSGYSSIESHQDLDGHDRFICAQWLA